MNIGNGGGSVEVMADYDEMDIKPVKSYLVHNPVDEVLTIASTNNKIVRVEIFDLISGQPNIISNNGLRLNVSNLTKGLYLVRVINSDQEVQIIKMMKK